MTPIPLGLFQLLGSAAASVVRPASSTSVEGVSFEELLELARSGEIASGRGVEIQPNLGLTLTNDQLARLSDAADRAMDRMIEPEADTRCCTIRMRMR